MKPFEAPELRLVELDVEDIITTSGFGDSETPIAPILPGGGQ